VVLERSGHFLTAGGAEQGITPTYRAQMLAGLGAAAGQAMRTLGFAYANIPGQLDARAV